MLLAFIIPLMNGSGYYVLFSYMPTLLKGSGVGFSSANALLVTAFSLVAICIAIPLAGKLSDRIGRKKVLAGAAIGMTIVAIPCYYIIFTGNMGLAILGACLMAVVFAGHTGVIHITIVELFPTRIRYSAYGLGLQRLLRDLRRHRPAADDLADRRRPATSTCPPSTRSSPPCGTLAAVLTIKDRSQEPLRDFCIRHAPTRQPGRPPSCFHPPHRRTIESHDILRLQDRPGHRRVHRHRRRRRRTARQAADSRCTRVARNAERLAELADRTGAIAHAARRDRHRRARPTL